MAKQKLPIGAFPYRWWMDSVRQEPSMKQLVGRFIAVSEAVRRYREAGLEPKHEWLMEIGSTALWQKE